MDLNRFKSIITNEINTAPLKSLKIQNHIYGCFVIMEDIAQSTVDLSGDEVLYPEFTFSLDSQFGEIGKKYGFVSNEQILLDTTIQSEYKELWLETFRFIDLCKDIEEVDKIEDLVIDLCRTVPQDIAFFNNALATGVLPTEWIEKVLELLNPTENKVVETIEKVDQIQQAQQPQQQQKRSLLNTTRGKKIRRSTPKRVYLNRTRKSTKRNL